MFSKQFRAFEKGVRGVENILSAIGVVMFFVLMLLGAGDVIGRYLFNRPIMGTLEISQVLMAGMVLLAWAYTQAKKAHVRVEIVFSRYPPRAQAIIEFVILFISLALFSLITWRATTIAWSDWQLKRIIDTILIPLAPFKLFVSLGAFVICLEFIIQMVHLLPEMKRKTED
jgi:TRAP-type C4-dicarboxylate transport system permease small subunit